MNATDVCNSFNYWSIDSRHKTVKCFNAMLKDVIMNHAYCVFPNAKIAENGIHLTRPHFKAS